MISDKPTENLAEELYQMSADDLQDYFHRNSQALVFETLSDYLNSFLVKNQFSLNEFIKHCGVAPSYAYNLFGNKRSNPNKYKLIPICISLRMDLVEINRALLLAGQASLSPKIPRDCGIIICVNKGIYEIDQVNQYLFENGLEPFES